MDVICDLYHSLHFCFFFLPICICITGVIFPLSTKQCIQFHEKVMVTESLLYFSVPRCLSWPLCFVLVFLFNINIWFSRMTYFKWFWYKKGGYQSICFITWKEKLALKCQTIVKECGLLVNMLKTSGKYIKQHLAKSNPIKELKYSDNNGQITK